MRREEEFFVKKKKKFKAYNCNSVSMFSRVLAIMSYSAGIRLFNIVTLFCDIEIMQNFNTTCEKKKYSSP